MPVIYYTTADMKRLLDMSDRSPTLERWLAVGLLRTQFAPGMRGARRWGLSDLLTAYIVKHYVWLNVKLEYLKPLAHALHERADLEQLGPDTPAVLVATSHAAEWQWGREAADPFAGRFPFYVRIDVAWLLTDLRLRLLRLGIDGQPLEAPKLTLREHAA